MEIVIGNFTFVLKSKTVADNKRYMFTLEDYSFTETRNKIMFESYPTGRKNKKKILYAYTSVSQLGIWRLCYYYGNTLVKFDNYTQATMLHIKLQQFINDKFNELPFATDFTFSRKLIDKDVKKYGTIPKYKKGINENGAIACIIPEKIDIKSIENRYISFFPSTAITITKKSDYFTDNDFKVDSVDYLFTINITLESIRINMKMYRVKVSSNETIIMEIGKFTIKHLHKHLDTRTGYYICNMIKSDEITQYGLYSKYISGTCNPDRGKEEGYTSKPLEYYYLTKIYEDSITNKTKQNLNHPIYEYMGYRRQNIFPILQLRMKEKINKTSKKQTKCPKKRKPRTIKNI